MSIKYEGVKLDPVLFVLIGHVMPLPETEITATLGNN
jgi:hypothetical protein